MFLDGGHGILSSDSPGAAYGTELWHSASFLG